MSDSESDDMTREIFKKINEFVKGPSKKKKKKKKPLTTERLQQLRDQLRRGRETQARRRAEAKKKKERPLISFSEKEKAKTSTERPPQNKTIPTPISRQEPIQRRRIVVGKSSWW